MESMAGATSINGESADLAARSATGSTSSHNEPPKFLLLCAMDRASAVARDQIVCGRTWRCADGRYPVWRQLLQRRRFRTAGSIHARLVRRRASVTVLQG